MERVFPVLTPLAVDPAHPFPFIPNMGLVMALSLARDDDRGQMSALIPLPAQVERFVRLPGGEGPIRFIMLEELVAMNMGRLFPGFTVQGSGLFRVIRDTDVEFEEEAEDLVRSYETALKRRRRGVAIALTMPPTCRLTCANWSIDADRGARRAGAIPKTGLIGLVDVKQLIVDDRPDLLFPPYTRALPRAHPRFRRRLLRRDPRQGHSRPSPVREFRRGGAVPAPGGARPCGGRHQADALSHQPRLARSSRR